MHAFYSLVFFKIHKVECMLNWLFSSFTYLPNFIIWLPSFSSPWLVQLATKCHLAIFTFGRFLDFFHSVKKVFGSNFGSNFAWGEISQGAIFSVEKVWGVTFTGGSLIGIRVLPKNKKENYNPAHEMVEKFRKSLVLSICLSWISHIID